MFRVGLTGGIASGKSTISQLFEELGITVIDTDFISHELMKPGQKAYQKTVQHFGSEILDSDLNLKRGLLRKKVFDQPDQKEWLENMIHPLIQERSELEIQAAQSEYALLVVPLMFESGFDQLVDYIVAIDCPASVQKKRLMERDGIDETLAEKMISAQFSNDHRISLSNQLLQNKDDGDRVKDVKHLHEKLKQLAANQVNP